MSFEYVNYLPKIQDEEKELRHLRAVIAAEILRDGIHTHESAVRCAFELIDEVKKQEQKRVDILWENERRRQKGY